MAKRGQNEGTIRKRKDGKWEARITIGINPDGKQHRKSVYGKTRQEVSSKMTDLLNDLNKGNLVDPTDITVSQWLDRWMQDYKKLQLKPATYINYVGRINNQINPILGKYKLTDLRIDIIQKFVNELIRKGLASETIYGAVKVLKGAIKQAYINGMISKNVTYGITMPKCESKIKKVLTLDEQHSFMENAKNTIHGEVFILDLFTGMRIGELLALRWSDINFEKNYLQVNRTITIIKDLDNPDGKWYKDFGTPKTKSSNRTIPLNPSAIDLIEKIKSEQTELRHRIGTAYEDNDLIFCTGLGKPLDPRNMQRTFHSICKKSGLHGFSIHCLRHSFATLGYEQGIDIRVLQELLGHANINETANRYTHVSIDTIRREMEKMKFTANL